MTDAQIEVCDDLWRKALEAGLVRWMPGMLVRSKNNYHRPARIESLEGDDYGLTVVPGADGPVFASHHEYGIAGSFPRGSTLPVWTDPATLGCLLAMAREATGDPTLYACVVPGVLLDGDDKWCALLDRRRPLIQADTEPEALLRAILAAKG